MGGFIKEAFLWLSLIPKGDAVETDFVQVDGLDAIGGCSFCSKHKDLDLFDISSPSTVKVDLMQYYSSDELIGVIDITFGYVPILFGDDSFVTEAAVQIHSVPEPLALSLFSLGLIGLAGSARSHKRGQRA
jgi:hypothetical protein